MLDNFYLPLTQEQQDNVANYDFDSPEALDWPLIIQTLRDLKNGRAVSVPDYCFKTNARLSTSIAIDKGADVVVVEVSQFCCIVLLHVVSMGMSISSSYVSVDFGVCRVSLLCGLQTCVPCLISNHLLTRMQTFAWPGD
jgi:hypothetical protein